MAVNSKKIFVDCHTIRNNALMLASKIHKDGFIPDLIYVSLRGGAVIGNVISEYFKILTGKGERPVYFATVVARSYSDLHSRQEIIIDGWTYPPEHLRHGDKVMIVDDIFDSGHTINRLVDIVLAQGIAPHNIRVAVHDYKLRKYAPLPKIQPNYFCVKHEINVPEQDCWIHYLSHELQGLTREEVQQYYTEEVQDVLYSILEE